jgi:hypothetical protein
MVNFEIFFFEILGWSNSVNYQTQPLYIDQMQTLNSHQRV